MTRYCVASDQHALIAVWGTGEGDLARSIAAMPGGADLSGLLGLARALTGLSRAAWRTYTHPASAAGSLEPNSEGWRREEERKHFGDVPGAVRRPHLPSGGGMLVSYSDLLESAHQVGRALHRLGDAGLVETVAAEVAAELAAVESAELGDLSGRSQQAVLLSREDASPVQVAAADRLLEQDPFGADALFVSIDPTAAAVAAAHWLAAAAEVASEASGCGLVHVVAEADNIEALPHQTPTLILGLLSAGASPHEAVTGLVRHAMHVVDGLLLDPGAVVEELQDAAARVAEYTGASEPDLSGVTLRLTPLDPARPARDLLEDLLTGIHGCWLLHSEYEEISPDSEEGDGEEAQEWDEEQAAQHTERSRENFARLVRETAAQHRERLV